MSDEEQALAYIKLQENVKDLVLQVITNDLITNHVGSLRSQMEYMIRTTIQDELKQYRIVKVGFSAERY